MSESLPEFPSDSDLQTCLRVLQHVIQQPVLARQAPGHAVFQHSIRLVRKVRKTKVLKPGLHEARIERARHLQTYAQDVEPLPSLPPVLPRFLEPGCFTANTFHEKCYVCKEPPFPVHEFYDQMCSACGDFNWSKRTATADFHGWVIVVTGARIKIGYEIALKLLRAGSQVVATTRFTKDAFLRFSHEPDFAAFRPRLHIEYLELGSLASLQALVQRLRARFPRIHALINNAAQTVRRSPEFYSREERIECLPSAQLGCGDVITAPDIQQPRALPCSVPLCSDRIADGEKGTLPSSSSKGVLPSLPSSSSLPPALLPPSSVSPELRDEYGQPVVTTEVNSWVLRFPDISVRECLEVHLVNAIAPFLLVQHLLPLLERKAKDATYGHVINVTSMEGSFSKPFKSGSHVHTNMAKASMNMITRTLGPSLEKHHRVLMNSVDTGWIDEMAPRTAQYSSIPAVPLDVVDGAARVIDPLLAHVVHGQVVSGAFFKNYVITDW